MGKQRNRPQMKEQENSPEELDEMEESNLSHREFRVMIIRILNSMKKDIETMQKDQSEIKNAISERNNILEGLNSRLDEAEDKISILEDKVEGNTHSNKREKILMNEDSLRNILDNIKHNNICIMGIPEGKEQARDQEPFSRNND